MRVIESCERRLRDNNSGLALRVRGRSGAAGWPVATRRPVTCRSAARGASRSRSTADCWFAGAPAPCRLPSAIAEGPAHYAPRAPRPPLPRVGTLDDSAWFASAPAPNALSPRMKILRARALHYRCSRASALMTRPNLAVGHGKGKTPRESVAFFFVRRLPQHRPNRCLIRLVARFAAGRTASDS